MILEHQLRIVGVAAVALGVGLVMVHARACASHDVTVVKIPVPIVVTRAPVAAADAPPAAPARPAPPATPAVPSTPLPAGIPTVTMSCMDATTELLVDDHRPVLCWGEHCLVYRDDYLTNKPRPEHTPRPASPPSKSGVVVTADRVCTGKRCDALGPKLRAALRDVEPSGLAVTRNHAAIVLGRSGGGEVWNRADDRPISLGKPSADEGEVVSVDVIGDHLIVGRSCNEFCSAIATVIDARGRRHGSKFASDPMWRGEAANIVAVDADLFIVFGQFGEITMISHGRPVASASFLPETVGPPHDVAVHAVALDLATVEAQWCVMGMCYLSRISLGGTEPDSEHAYLQLSDTIPLPSCSG